MKKQTILLLAILFSCIANGCNNSDNQSGEQVSISVSGAFALYPLMQQWADAYQKIHPEVRFDIQAGGAGKGLTDVMIGSVDVGMFSRELTNVEKAKGVWWIALCKDAVLPTVNPHNAYMEMLQLRGLKKEEFNTIFTAHYPSTWDSIFKINNLQKHPINVYTRADAAGAAESWAEYFGKHQDDIQGIGVSGDPGVAEAVKKDINGIGYNNTLFVYDIKTGDKIPGLEIIPIDINGNGRIDADENFYKDLSTFQQALKDGKYPSPPSRNLYFLTRRRTQNKAILEFFEWALTTGQQYVSGAGYLPLTKEVIDEQLKKIAPELQYEH